MKTTILLALATTSLATDSEATDEVVVDDVFTLPSTDGAAFVETFQS